jgi:predicted N-acetyltransferase YhbS
MEVLTDSQDRQADWIFTEVRAPRDALLDSVVAITTSAFAAGDLLPGLPAADGALDTGNAILSDLRSGVRLWLARSHDGETLGCVRAIPRPNETWQIRRLVVSIEAQGHGIARGLVRGLERAAMADGIRRLVVWALVERGIPPFYSRLGYRTTGHFGSPDKPLSEAIMEVRLAGPRPVLAYPWETEPLLPGRGVAVCWFGSGRQTVAVTTDLAPDPGDVVRGCRQLAAQRFGLSEFLGCDCWVGCRPEDSHRLAEVLASRADAGAAPVLLFRRPATAVREFTMPRALEPMLLAFCRTPLPPELRGHQA